MKEADDKLCAAFNSAMAILGRPWTGLVLRLLQGGPLRFKELVDGAEGVGTKILSARLKELEGRGLILRQVDIGPPIRSQYELTVKGRAFRDVIDAIQRWGQLIDDKAEPKRNKPSQRSVG